MTDRERCAKVLSYLKILCADIPGRSVGSAGNEAAASFFRNELTALGWSTEASEFRAMDWQEEGAVLRAAGQSFKVFPSPYSTGCSVKARLAAADTPERLERLDAGGTILLLYGELAKEQLMPKNFIFYNPEEHRRIVALMEKSGAAAFVCATGRNPALAGGAYPFPLIEDGDFDIPSVYMTEEEGARLLRCGAGQAELESRARRIASKGRNIIGRSNASAPERVVVTAHLDAKKGTPGAIDNATGVIVLLLLAELLKDYRSTKQLELAAFNGEDYYAVPGQMNYVRENEGRFGEILLNINIDGAGYREGGSVFSFFGLPDRIKAAAEEVMVQYPGITEGAQWPQGDHSIFIQQGRPAIAVSSGWLIGNMDKQDITHTPKDAPEIVAPQKVAEIAEALNTLIRKL
ncbi:MAG TPA: M28 family peptidase [Elusimicrobiales bacterium]|nr:M28 family peptidase [Elusimicrobiales bacterium]